MEICPVFFFQAGRISHVPTGLCFEATENGTQLAMRPCLAGHNHNQTWIWKLNQ